MRTTHSWKLQPTGQTVARKWRRGMLVLLVSLVLIALATAAATSKRSDRDGPAAISGMANSHSGAGNLVPVF